MFDLLIKNSRLPDNRIADVAVTDKKIAAIAPTISHTAHRLINLEGRYRLSAGWIDSHVHCNPASPIYYDEPDKVGIKSGVTTVIDAGSTGADDIAHLRAVARTCKTNVRALLNISRIGLITQHELANLDDIDMPLAGKAICAHCGFVIGIKARMSGSVIGDNGMQPLQLAKTIQSRNNNIPLMVHFGNKPPMVEDILALLGQGDILTHCFHGKPNGILTPEGTLRPAVRAALQRGLQLDVGHGTASFSFKVAEQALALGLTPDTISSDIYCKNREHGPVYRLAAVMTKFLALGMPLDSVIAAVTTRPAEIFGLQDKGQLEIGADADFTIFDVSATPQTITDSEGQTRTAPQSIIPHAAVVAGEFLPTAEGMTCHDFN